LSWRRIKGSATFSGHRQRHFPINGISWLDDAFRVWGLRRLRPQGHGHYSARRWEAVKKRISREDGKDIQIGRVSSVVRRRRHVGDVFGMGCYYPNTLNWWRRSTILDILLNPEPRSAQRLSKERNACSGLPRSTNGRIMIISNFQRLGGVFRVKKNAIELNA